MGSHKFKPNNFIISKEPDVLVTDYEYVEYDGKTAFTVRRKDYPNSDRPKETPLTKTLDPKYTEPGSRPLYKINQHLFNNNKYDILKEYGFCTIVVEGERCVNVVNKIFGEIIATTSLGGAKAPEKSDWTPLGHMSSRLSLPIVLCPDNDGPGERYIRIVYEIISKAFPRAVFKKCIWAGGTPEKFDVADWVKGKFKNV